ncbi:hypothetical protein DIPPA_28860 [Diplonema papillatum]|nr:hypothetical protein DIPPA_28860 [Diplonema papillatum]
MEVKWWPHVSTGTVTWNTSQKEKQWSDSEPVRLKVVCRDATWVREATMAQGDRGVTFGGLEPGTTYSLTVECGDRVAGMRVKTMDGRSTRPTWLLPYSTARRGDLMWVRKAPGDHLRSTGKVAEDEEFMDLLIHDALFALPDGNTFTCIPNPLSRFAIDLTKKINWQRSRRMRNAELAKYRLTVDCTFRASLALAGQLHGKMEASKHGSTDFASATWVTPELVDTLTRSHAKGEHDGIVHHSFELWAGDTLAAVSLGCGVGEVYYDYTHGAVIRDHRRLGTMLTKVVGHLITQAGYKFWYWGARVPETAYMGDYLVHYGAAEYSRDDFFAVWDPLVAKPLPSPGIERVLAEGRSLVKMKPNPGDAGCPL